MKLYELTFEYHDELNPKIWNKGKLRPEVLEKLREIAKHFFKFIDVPDLKIEDIVLTGSLANYNYTPYSDIDIHLICDVKKAAEACKDITAQMFDSKKDLWAQKYHEVRVCDFPVEVFVQDNSAPNPVAMGIYSIQNDKWIQKPKFDRPKIDKNEIEQTTKEFKKDIETVIIKDEGKDKAKELKKELKKEREKGLHKDGEFSDENIAFKELRNRGIIGKLMNYIKDQDVEKMSLEAAEMFQDQPKDLVHLFKVQAARTVEWLRFEKMANDRYKFFDQMMNTTEELIVLPFNKMRFPWAIISMKESINTALYDKLETVFVRMIEAKKAYEAAGGKYDGWK